VDGGGRSRSRGPRRKRARGAEPTHLGYGEAGNGEPGDDVGAEEPRAVLRPPLEDGEEVVQRQHQPPRRRLVLELVQRVVGEEHLRQALPQRLGRRARLRQRHLVQLQDLPRRVGARRRLDVVREAVHLVVHHHGGQGLGARGCSARLRWARKEGRWCWVAGWMDSAEARARFIGGEGATEWAGAGVWTTIEEPTQQCGRGAWLIWVRLLLANPRQIFFF
jgi:hypothetical protein